MKPLEIQCLFYTEEQEQLAGMGIELTTAEVIQRPVTFYSINAISPFIEDGIEYSFIESGGADYTVPMKYSELKKIVDQAHK